MGEKNYERGFTFRSILATLYVAAILQPAVVWVYLATGLGLWGVTIYAVIYLFSELAIISGRPLTKQEVLVLLVGGSSASLFYSFGTGLIFAEYFRRHPLIAAAGLTNRIPNWYAPPVDSPVWGLRTLFHPDWIIPISLILVFWVSVLMIDLSLGYLASEIYIEREKLPFPMQQVQAQICTTLSKKKMPRVFIVCAVFGFAYEGLLFGLPTITGAMWNVPIWVIPIPWIDLNFLVEKVLPGASFGISTDLFPIALGLILPPVVTFSIFMGSMALYFFGNWLLVQQGLFTDWSPGMSLGSAWNRSVLNFWAGPNILLTIAAGVLPFILPLVLHPKRIIAPFKGLSKPHSSGRRGTIFITKTFLVFLLGIAINVITVHILVPGFPVWILLLASFGLTFLLTNAYARSIGVTGMTPDILFTPYITRYGILASGYKGVDIWFAPILVSAGGSGWVANFKTAELTLTPRMDIIKALLIAVPLGMLFALIYTQMFWSISPIPSSIFPVPYWDVDVTMTYFFVSGKAALFKVDWMVATFLVGIVLQGLSDFAHLPISLIGIAAGATSPIATSVGMLLGIIVGKVLQRVFGKIWFQTQASTIMAGLMTGEGLVIAFSAAIAMIFKSTWILPY